MELSDYDPDKWEKLSAIEKTMFDFSNKNTIRRYRYCINEFFKFLKINPDDYVKRMKGNPKGIEMDIWNFILHLQDEVKLAPKSLKLHISALRKFCLQNDLEMPPRVFETLRRRTPRAVSETHDAVPTRKILRDIFQHTDFKTKCAGMILLSSGMRIGELVKIMKEDIEEYKGFIKITVRRDVTKSKYDRVTFISSEAKELLDQWLTSKRKEYMDQARLKTNFKGKKKVSARDPRVFPMWDSTIRVSWIGALERSGHNERCQSQSPRNKNNTYVYHLHTLRKFFETNLSGKINMNALDIMIGHSNELDKTYIDVTYPKKIEQLYNEYKKGEGHISIYTTGISEGQVANLELQLKERDKKLDEVTQRLDRFVNLRKRRGIIFDKIISGKCTKEEEEKLQEELGDIDTELLDM